MKLQKHHLEKPWGLSDLPAPFGSTGGSKIGEISFSPADDRALPLLLKYIFTSEKLSVQVHPDDRLGRAKGYPHGKTECWYILDAAPDARLALGFKSEVDADTVRNAALDGSIEDLLEWLPATSGDFFHVPAGTVHAIGAGITLLEVQQNLDVTYRLYDYGRPRELHLSDALSAAKLHPYDRSSTRQASAEPAQVFVSDEHFSLLRIEGPSPVLESLGKRGRWVVPLRGQAFGKGCVGNAGDCLYLAPGDPLSHSKDILMLVALEGRIY